MTDINVQPVAQTAPGLSQTERVSNTFLAPSKTFADIKNGHRAWWLPFIIYVVLGYGFFFVVNSKIGMRQVAENQIHLSPKAEERSQSLAPEQREQQMKFSVYFIEGAFYAGPAFLIIMGLVISLVMWGTINLGFGGRAKFGSVLAVWMYAMLPSVIKSLLGIVMVYAGAAPESFNIKNFAPTNVGAFLNPTDVGPVIYSLATSIDVITIWTLILVGIGTAMVAGVKRSSGYIAAFGWWVLIVLLSMGGAAVMG